jgi:hypothetical protein
MRWARQASTLGRHSLSIVVHVDWVAGRCWPSDRQASAKRESEEGMVAAIHSSIVSIAGRGVALQSRASRRVGE